MSLAPRRLVNLLLGVVGLFLFGCGGGGGGGGSAATVASTLGGCSVAGSTVTIAYSTDWGSAPTSASQLLELVGADGSVQRTDLLNRSTGNTINLTGNNSAVYSLRAKLYSGTGATGTLLGTAQQTVNLCPTRADSSTISVLTTNSATPTTTNVTFAGPFLNTSAGVQITKGLKLTVYPTVTANGAAVFVDPTLVTYTVSNSIGSVDSTSSFLAIAPGTGTITANYPGAVLKVPSTLTVTDSAPKSTWTVLVYMNAANDLDQFSLLNMNQLEQAAGIPGNVRFVVQWKQSTALFPSSTFDGTRRYLVTLDNTSTVNSQLLQSNMTEPDGSPLDMGKWNNLNDFIKWGKANYPSDHTCLVIWNHGNGWRRGEIADLPTRGFSYDDQSRNNIQTWQIPQAFGTEHLDIVAWDCSLMQMTEVAYELRNNCDYVVGSEESPPGEGYPYDSVFGVFRDNPTQSVEQLAHAFVDKTLAVPDYASRKITQSVVKTSALPALAASVNTLGQNLFSNAINLSGPASDIRANGQTYSFATDYRYYYDLVDICNRLEADARVNSAIKTASADVRAKAAAAIVYEGHNSNSAGSHGLAIDWSPSGYFVTVRADYDLLDFAKDTAWDEWLSAQPGP